MITMDNDPFHLRRFLLELAFTVLIVSFCLHWAALLVAEVWPWLVGIGCTLLIGALLWRWRQRSRGW